MPQVFPNWVPSSGKDAGVWGRDEIRNITGTSGSNNSTGGYLSPTGAFVAGSGCYSADARTSSRNVYIKFDASKSVPTGPENVPPHVWQPLMIYLGRPA